MSLPDEAARILRQRGIDPDDYDLPAREFDPAHWRVEQQELALDAAIPARFAQVEPTLLAVLGWVERFVSDPRRAPSVLLTGPTGSGKSHQAYGALRAAVLRCVTRGRNVTWRAVTHPDLNAELRPRPDGGSVGLDRYLGADLLLLDDLGAGRQTEWTGDSLHRLVDHRWSNALPTIYTTNLNARDLTAAVGARVVSRVGDGLLVVMEGPDRRRGGGR